MYTPIEQGLTSPPYTQKTQIRPVSLADSIWFFNEIPLSVPAHNSTAQINGLFHILLLQPGTNLPGTGTGTAIHHNFCLAAPLVQPQRDQVHGHRLGAGQHTVGHFRRSTHIDQKLLVLVARHHVREFWGIGFLHVIHIYTNISNF